MTVYDTLPQIGDRNVFATTDRGSEFDVRLREGITPPEGYTVFYTTSAEVYQKSMTESEYWYMDKFRFRLLCGYGV